MIVKIEKLDHQGRGIAYLNKPVFIDNALIDEVVDIKIIKEYSKYCLGKVIKYIETSNKRIEPICKYYGECGGCQLMHMSYNDQLDYKENKVKQIMQKFFKQPVKINKIINSEDMFYRNKATFKVDSKIGYYKIRSNDVVDIDECLIVDKRINDELRKLKKQNIKDTNEIVVRCGENLVNSYNSNDYVIMKLNDYKFYVYNDSFFQVNIKQTIKLYDKILEYLDLTKDDNVLDLYCGVGSIGIYISKYCNYVYGVEINEHAIDSANKNKILNNIKNIDFKCLNASMISSTNYDTNKVVVDPPRSGLDKQTIEYLNNNKFDKIVYVSCDPVTLARDLNLLSANYDIVEVTPVDMFPNTYHIECVCNLDSKKKI